MIRLIRPMMALVCGLVLAATADAQTLGTFRWQMQPFCNVVTLNVRQTGVVFRLEGADDQCGDAVRAPVAGAAVLNPNGSVSLGLVIVSAPSGIPLHLDVSIDVRTASGAWRDGTGRQGAFAFTSGASAGGDRRPDVPVELSGATLGNGIVKQLPGSARIELDLMQLRRSLNFLESGSGLAIGNAALSHATGGADNTALGAHALSDLSTGLQNTAVGLEALRQVTTGVGNEAIGASALGRTTTGQFNVGIGNSALVSTSGSRNIGIGLFALAGATGSDNIAIDGFRGGDALTGGNNNIYVGSFGFPPDDNTIRIGEPEHVGAFIAGISGRTSSAGVPVLVNPGGRLGTITSSVRFKDDVQAIGDRGDTLFALRPVQFLYTPDHDDGSRQLQYGLIAEEVAATFPELAVFDRDGRPSAVRYHLLTPLLLHHVQRLRAKLAALKEVVP